MEEGCSPAYVNRSLAALRTFYRYCLQKGVITVDPAHSVIGPKKEKRLPVFLKEREMERLLKILDEGEQSFNNIRTRTIIYILYLTGMRAAELIDLDDTMIDFVSLEIKVTGKRNKQRIIPFGRELHDVLKEYIAVRDENVSRMDNALFVTDKGRRMTYNNLRMMVRDSLSLVSTQKKRSPHVLRHTFATSMLNNDANLESIKKLLGHESVETTEIYTHTTFEQLRKVYESAHPRNNP